MKKLLVGLLSCIMLFSLCGCRMVRNIVTFHENEGRYSVMRINSDTNREKENKNYFYGDNWKVCRYSFEDKSLQICLETSDFTVSDYAIWGNWIYYVKQLGENQEILWINYITGENEIVFSNKELIILNKDKPFRIGEKILLDIYEESLFLRLGGSRGYIYSCLTDKNKKENIIELNSLLATDNSKKEEKQVIFNGLIISGFYDNEEQRYIVENLREKGTRYEVLLYLTSASTLFEGREIHLWKEYDKGFYYGEDKRKGTEITCLGDDKYKYSDIYEPRLTVENGEIIGLVSVSQDPRVSWKLHQSVLENDVLFKLNPETGESSILYETSNNRTRIVGYKEGIVYLLKNYEVYSQSLDGKNKTKLFSLEKDMDYIFDWQAGYLIVRYNNSYPARYEVAAVYKTE